MASTKTMTTSSTASSTPSPMTCGYLTSQTFCANTRRWPRYSGDAIDGQEKRLRRYREQQATWIPFGSVNKWIVQSHHLGDQQANYSSVLR